MSCSAPMYPRWWVAGRGRAPPSRRLTTSGRRATRKSLGTLYRASFSEWKAHRFSVCTLAVLRPWPTSFRRAGLGGDPHCHADPPRSDERTPHIVARALVLRYGTSTRTQACPEAESDSAVALAANRRTVGRASRSGLPRLQLPHALRLISQPLRVLRGAVED